MYSINLKASNYATFFLTLIYKMVRKNGKEGYRSFTLGASKTAQCKTKGYGGRFINKTPAEAARKAFSDLFRVKYPWSTRLYM